MGKEVNQTRITAWIDNDVFESFRRHHPGQGAITKFVRRSLEAHLRKMGVLGANLTRPLKEGE